MQEIKTKIKLGYKSAQWFIDHADLVLDAGQMVFLEEIDFDNPSVPIFKRGDNVNALEDLIWSDQGNSGVQSVTGSPVDNTDPLNPIVNAPTQTEFNDLQDDVDDLESAVADLEIDIETKQPLDADLTDLAGIVGVNGDFIYREGGTWVRKTTMQVRNVLKSPIIYGQNNIAENHTGDTNEFLLNYFIEFDPAVDEFGLNDWLEILIKRNTSASGDDKFLRVYIGPTSGTLVGAVQVIHHNNVTVGALASPTKRTLNFNNSITQLKGMNLGVTTANSDEAVNSVAYATFTVNFAVKQYLMFTVQNEVAGQTSGLDSVLVKHSKPAF